MFRIIDGFLWVFIDIFISKAVFFITNCFLDECNDHHDCKKNERCNYVSSSNRYECTCNQGYRMVNGNCMVSDCSTNAAMCHINGQCVFAKDGSGYKCICIDGYRGDGVNQCLEDYIGCNVLNTCGRNAVCGYNQTSANYVCVCQPVSPKNTK